MRKKLLLLLPLCLLLAAAWAFASGNSGESLATLSYLNGIFTGTVDAAVDARLDAALPQDGGAMGAPAPAASSAWTEIRLKEGDLLLGGAGDSVLLLAGSGQINCSFGAVVDATTGAEVPSGSALSPRHRYIVAEDSTAGFTVTGKTAVLDYQGNCTLNYSNATDYNAMASALKALHLFQGSPTGYGQGFDLEATPTRLQALIMFIRVLGEEQEALAWSGSTPFQDVQRGSLGEKYIGYAYEKGYTNGYTGTQFRPAAAVSARQYTEFLLRALGYSTAGGGKISEALTRAQAAGVLTPGETAALQTGPFLRADLVYISYYALEARLAGGSRTLAEDLMNKGVFTRQERERAAEMVTGWRL